MSLHNVAALLYLKVQCHYILDFLLGSTKLNQYFQQADYDCEVLVIFKSLQQRCFFLNAALLCKFSAGVLKLNSCWFKGFRKLVAQPLKFESRQYPYKQIFRSCLGCKFFADLFTEFPAAFRDSFLWVVAAFGNSFMSALATFNKISSVRYHFRGSMELNACILLLAPMVYL